MSFIFCLCLCYVHWASQKLLSNAEKSFTLLWFSSFVLIIFKVRRLQCKKTKFPRSIYYHWFIVHIRTVIMYCYCNNVLWQCLKWLPVIINESVLLKFLRMFSEIWESFSVGDGRSLFLAFNFMFFELQCSHCCWHCCWLFSLMKCIICKGKQEGIMMNRGC